MRDATMQFQTDVRPVGALGVDARATFISRTYAHLLVALVAFTLFEVALFTSGAAQSIFAAISGTSWLLILGGFLVVGYLGNRLAISNASRAVQYVGLGLTVAIWGVIFVPLLYIANEFAPGAITNAALVSLLGFTALTAIVFATRKDFSFLRGVVMWGFGLALVAIVASVVFGFTLGTGFCVLMVGLAGASILYDTSNVLHHFPEDKYVAASLSLFTSVAILFYYVLILFLNRD